MIIPIPVYNGQVDTNVYWFALDPNHASYAATLTTLAATAGDVPSDYGTYAVTAGANGYSGLNIVGPCYGLNGLSISASGVCRDIFNYICSKNPNYAAPTLHTNAWGDSYTVYGKFLKAPRRIPTTGEDARLNDAKGVGSNTICYVGQENTGDGSGSSYENQRRIRDFLGDSVATLASYDIVVLCGTLSRFSNEGSLAGLTSGAGFNIKDGSASARTIVISHPVDTACVMGGVKLGAGANGEASAWTDESGSIAAGVFSFDLASSAVGHVLDLSTTVPRYVLTNAGGGNPRALTRVSSTGALASDTFYMESTTKIYVKLADGSNPKSTTFVGPSNAGGVNMLTAAKTHFDVYGVRFYQARFIGAGHYLADEFGFYACYFGYWGGGPLFVADGHGVNTKTGQFVSGNNQYQHLTPSAPNGRVLQGNHMEYGGDGLYDNVGHCLVATNTTVRDNLFTGIGKIAFGINPGDSDSHSVAVLGSWDGASIINNAFDDTGWLPTVIYTNDTGSAAPATDLTDGVITNSSFAADTDWTKGGGATISGGAANLTSSGHYVEQQVTIGAGYTAKRHVLKGFLTQLATRVRVDVGTTSGGTDIFNGASSGNEITSNPQTGVWACDFVPGATSFYIRITRSGTNINVTSAELLTTLADEEGFVLGFPAAKRFNNGVSTYVCQPCKNIEIAYNRYTNPITSTDNPEISPEGMAISLNGDVTYGYAGQISNIRVHHNRIEGDYGSSLRQKWQLPSPYDQTQIEWSYNVIRGADLYAFRGTVSTFTDENGLAADNSFYFHHNDVHVASGGKYVFLASTANPSRHNMVLDYNTYRIQTGALGWESAGAQVDTDIANWRTRAPTGDTYDTNSTHVALGA